MTPEERELVADLFSRLAALERSPRDPDAERAIREGLARAPNAVYALVQTVLLQDEALKTANDRITNLEDELDGGAQRERSFLRDRAGSSSAGKWNTGEVLRGTAGSVPSVGGRDRDQPMGVPSGYDRDRRYRDEDYRDEPRGGYGDPRGGYAAPQAGGYGEPSRGGGFLGTAAAVAAGAIGGGLLLNGIRSALGGQGGAQGGQDKSPFASAFDQLTGGKSGSQGESGGGSGDLAREAGLGDVGRGGGQGAVGSGDTEQNDRFGFANSKEQNFDADDSALDDGSMEEDFADDAFDDEDL